MKHRYYVVLALLAAAGVVAGFVIVLVHHDTTHSPAKPSLDEQRRGVALAWLERAVAGTALPADVRKGHRTIKQAVGTITGIQSWTSA